MGSINLKKQVKSLNYRSHYQDNISIDWDKSMEGRQHEAVVVVDADGQIVFVSETVLSWLGISGEEIRGRNYRYIIQKYEIIKDSILLDTLDNGINYEGVMVNIEIGNHPVHLECSTMLLVDSHGYKIGALLYIRDITARVNGDRQLQRFKTMHTISNFATSMAHHMKNPLTAVTGFLQLIKNQAGDDNLQQYCTWALEELDRIEEVLERISLLAVPTGGQQLIPLLSLLQGVKRSLQTTAATMWVEVQIDELLPEVIIKGHYEQLREAIMCLAHNGMEAMPFGGILQISAHYHQKLAMVEIRIIDAGVGSLNLKDAFQPFYSSRVDRTGLGLNIAEHIAMMHRGYIRLQPNKTSPGTTASLFLPAAANITKEAAGIKIN